MGAIRRQAFVLIAIGVVIGLAAHELMWNKPSEGSVRTQNLEAALNQARQANQKLEAQVQRLRKIRSSLQPLGTHLDKLDNHVQLSSEHTSGGDPAAEADSLILAQQQRVLRNLMNRELGKAGMRSYSEFFRKLGYTKSQQDMFMALWMQTQSELIEQTMTQRGTPSNDKEHGQDITSVAASKPPEAIYEEKLEEFLGNDYSAYRDYSDTLRERQLVNKFSATLQVPLDDFTREELIRIMGEESNTENLPRSGIVSFPENTLEASTGSEATESTLAAMRLRDEKVVERSGDYLTTQQQSQLEQTLQRQRSMLELATQLSSSINFPDAGD